MFFSHRARQRHQRTHGVIQSQRSQSVGRPGEKNALSGVLSSMESARAELVAARETIEARIAAYDDAIATLCGSSKRAVKNRRSYGPRRRHVRAKAECGPKERAARSPCMKLRSES